MEHRKYIGAKARASRHSVILQELRMTRAGCEIGTWLRVGGGIEMKSGRAKRANYRLRLETSLLIEIYLGLAAIEERWPVVVSQ